MVDFHLKPATSEDTQFIFDLRLLTMKPFFAPTIGWDDKAQLRSAAEHIDEAEIIYSGEERIGVVKVLDCETHFTLHQIQVKPEFQKQGVGSVILKHIISKAEGLGLPIRLMVMKETPAQKIYELHGFVVVKSYTHNIEMVKEPSNGKNV